MSLSQQIGQFLINIGRSLRGTVEQPNPGDWVDFKEENDNETLKVWISQYLKIPSPDLTFWFPPIPDTNSMDPVFDEGNNNILIWSRSPEGRKAILDHLQVGDIAVYNSVQGPIIHRIIEIGQDAQGRYFRFAGDNNAGPDNYQPRDENIMAVSIGTIY